MSATANSSTEICFNDYTEPVYPMTKRERFDEDYLKPVLSDTRFNKKDRERLSNYNKHRFSGGEIAVSYRLGAGCEEFKLGRLFPHDGIGLQSFRFDMRNPMAKKYYWDVDMDNCHYRIAYAFCERYHIKNDKIQHYIQNREACLASVSDPKKKAKTEFLKILYGGDIKLYHEGYDEVDGSVKSEGYKLLKGIEGEVAALMAKIWDEHPHLHKLKTGSDAKPLTKKRNPKASLMSLIFQTEERKMLMFLDWLLIMKGRNLAVFIHDGGYVERMEGETYFPPEILDECARHIESYFQIPMVLTQKEIAFEYAPPVASESVYDIKKREFEERNFFVKDIIVHINQDYTIEFLKPATVELQERCNHYTEYDPTTDKMVKKYFFKEWLEDPNRAKYEKIDFIPDVEACPSYVYNLFRGFKASKITPTSEYNDMEIKTMVYPIIRHIALISGGSHAYVLKWMANLIQNPMRKTEVALLFRDIGGFLTEGGETGKSCIFDYFGNDILGEEYYYTVHDNRELYGNFNSQFQGKLLIVVDEASSKDNHSNHDILKAKITAKKQNVNQKNVAAYQVADYANYIFNSNNANPLPIKQGNRRMAATDARADFRGDVDYFKKLTAYISQNDVRWCFFQYLKRIVVPYDSPIDYQVNIPITPAYVEIRRMNAPLYLKWVVHELQYGTLRKGSVRSLYERFVEWAKSRREGKEDTILTETKFGMILSNAKELESEQYETGEIDMGRKSKSHGSMVFNWNIPELVKGLKGLHLLDDDFVYFEQTVEESENDGEPGSPSAKSVI